MTITHTFRLAGRLYVNGYRKNTCAFICSAIAASFAGLIGNSIGVSPRLDDQRPAGDQQEKQDELSKSFVIELG